ncbi:hypothetical protein ACQEU8_02515 [Streptomyces sp. CA-250714]|uniref:hypothetical protein n=1 Tax=Streptomyces sp. CA-250714 TaxID=3240060 RepID=UPI003D8D4C98
MRELLGPEDGNGPQIDAQSFASQAPDGRSVLGLLAQAIPTTLRALSRGTRPPAAMASGAVFLDMAARTTVADTGRQADQVAMVGNRKVTAYVRVVELPACSRCIILSGREYGTTAGFLRHPRCDCTMQPITKRSRKRIQVPDPEEIFERMTPAQRKAAFGEAGAKAIQDGARISSVVNARKGMAVVEAYGKRVQATYSGTGRRRANNSPRLMPEEIYRIADSRTEAIRLLYRNGYLR